MPSWRRVFTSEEARIESLAGQSLPETAGPRARFADAYNSGRRGAGASDWPMPSPPPFPADDEDDEAPEVGAS